MNQRSPEQREKIKRGGNRFVGYGLKAGTLLAILFGALVVMSAFSGCKSDSDDNGQDEQPVRPEAVEATITIVEPAAGEVVDLSGAIAVSGESTGLPEGDVVVRAVNNEGAVLAEGTTALHSGGAGPGEPGLWTIELVVPAAPGTAGLITVSSTSPSGGQTAVTDNVAVTFGQEPVIEPFMVIEGPAEGATLDTGEPVTVSGRGGALFEGNVVVEALDAAGNLLVRMPATVQAGDAGMGGEGPWSVELAVPVSPGTAGQIRAYATSAKDGQVVASDSVNVTFGQAVEAPETGIFITILSPVDRQTLDPAGSITVSGRAAGMFEGNVVVQALDAAGNVLAQQATIIQAEDAGIGGEGPWSVELAVQAAPGTAVQIRAFSLSPKDGSIEVEDSVTVTYGG